MNSLLGLGHGLPVKSANTSVSKDGGNEGIGRYGAFSATPQSSTSAQPTLYGTKFGDLSDAMQSVMLEMQATGSGSTSFADAMANAAEQSKDANSNIKDGVINSTSKEDNLGFESEEPSAEEEFDKAVKEALEPPSKDEKKKEKADLEQAKAARQHHENQVEANLAEADMQASVAGLDSRVSAQLMASSRSVNAMTGSLAA